MHRSLPFPDKDAAIVGASNQDRPVIIERHTANFRLGIRIFQFDEATRNKGTYERHRHAMLNSLNRWIVHMMTKIPYLNLTVQCTNRQQLYQSRSVTVQLSIEDDLLD